MDTDCRECQDGDEFDRTEYRFHGREFTFPFISPQATKGVNREMSFHFVEVLLTGCKREKRAANW